MAAEEGWGCLFHWGAFGIEGMIGEKIISTSFGGAASHGKRAPGTGAAHARTAGALAAQPLHGAN
jgi:S-adenosylmethionine synthetase